VLEPHEAAEEGIVSAVGVSSFAAQQLVEGVFRLADSISDKRIVQDARAPQAKLCDPDRASCWASMAGRNVRQAS